MKVPNRRFPHLPHFSNAAISLKARLSERTAKVSCDETKLAQAVRQAEPSTPRRCRGGFTKRSRHAGVGAALQNEAVIPASARPYKTKPSCRRRGGFTERSRHAGVGAPKEMKMTEPKRLVIHVREPAVPPFTGEGRSEICPTGFQNEPPGERVTAPAASGSAR